MTGLAGFEVTLNREQWDRLERRLNPRVLKLAGAAALNRTAAQGRTRAVREISKTFGLRPQKNIRPYITWWKAKPSSLEARIYASGRTGQIPVLNPAMVATEKPYWRGRQTRRGVKAKVMGSFRSYLRSWIMPEGARRGGTGRAFQRLGRKRYPIRQIKEHTLPELFEMLISRGLDTSLARNLEARLAHEIRWRIARGQGR